MRQGHADSRIQFINRAIRRNARRVLGHALAAAEALGQAGVPGRLYFRKRGPVSFNAQAVQGCLDDPKAKEELAADVAEGNRLGVNSTPTVYVNGKKLPRINDFVAVVDKEARKKGFPPLAQ